MKKILLAGIGNVFQGDDAFGCEVIRQLDARSLPAGVTVRDFGIRSYDLAYALTDDYEAIVLIDAAGRGEPPGTLYLIEPDLPAARGWPVAVDPHAMNPVAVIQMAQSLGGVKGKLFLVACEPGELGGDEGQLGLSAKVQQALPGALDMVRALLNDLAGRKASDDANLTAA